MTAQKIYNQKNKSKKNYLSLTDNELWKAYHQGDRKAFGTLFQRHQLKLYLVVNNWVRDPDKAKDIVQEVSIKILEKGSNVAHIEIDNFFVWAAQFAKNIWRSGNRNTRRRAEIMEEEIKPYTVSAYELHAGEDVDKMVSCLKRVKKVAHRRILVLAYQGYKNPEIAVRLNKTTKWVKDNRCLAKKEFKRLLTNDGLYFSE